MTRRKTLRLSECYEVPAPVDEHALLRTDEKGAGSILDETPAVQARQAEPLVVAAEGEVISPSTRR